MATTTIPNTIPNTRTNPRPTSTGQNRRNDRTARIEQNKESDMTTFDIAVDSPEPPGRAPLEPDSPCPSGRDPDTVSVEDESLAARTPVARCADGNGTLAALFFSDHVADIARAKAMCALCPLSAECLSGALEREEPWGVWGGELISGGRIIANKRPCGRPPKSPRPDVVYDEMGPVGVAV
jgi:WhiB family redox-sensing transcriptional regulator